MLRALHDSGYYGGIINTDIINKGKLPDTSCPLLVEKEESKCKKVSVVSHCPPQKSIQVGAWMREYTCMWCP